MFNFNKFFFETVFIIFINIFFLYNNNLLCGSIKKLFPNKCFFINKHNYNYFNHNIHKESNLIYLYNKNNDYSFHFMNNDIPMSLVQIKKDVKKNNNNYHISTIEVLKEFRGNNVGVFTCLETFKYLFNKLNANKILLIDETVKIKDLSFYNQFPLLMQNENKNEKYITKNYFNQSLKKTYQEESDKLLKKNKIQDFKIKEK